MIYPFNSTPIPTLAYVGGKGLSLIKMTHADLPVPTGFVCSVAFFSPWLTALQATPEWTAVQSAIQNNQELQPSTIALQAHCSQLALTPEQEQQLNTALQALPSDTLFAVRSSSPEEDLEGASFAGGYTTSLGITPETMLDALRASFASAFDERVFVYKKQQGFGVDDPRIAVVVQQQIASDIAGVGFSLNPLNNDYDEAVIDANWGLGESVVAGIVSPDHFVVNKVSKTIVERVLGGKETTVRLTPTGGVQEQATPNAGEFCLTDTQIIAITEMLIQIETLYGKPTDIEWAFADDTLYMLQARPITAYIPLASEMMTQPNERRILYFDASLAEGVTTNKPLMPLTLDWLFGSLGMFLEPVLGSVHISADDAPAQSLMFGTGGRFYINFSQIMTLTSLNKAAMSMDGAQKDVLLMELLANVDEDRYRAEKKIPSLGWGSLIKMFPRVLWSSRRLMGAGVSAFSRPEKFYEKYEPIISQSIKELKLGDYAHLTVRETINSLKDALKPVMGGTSFPAIIPFLYAVMQLDKLFDSASAETKQLVESLSMGFADNDAVKIGVEQYRMAKMLTAADFSDLDALVQRISARQLPVEFMTAWDKFVADFGLRGPGELELANSRYGDDPRLLLEQMSYMVDSDFDPIAMQAKHVAGRQEAYETLLGQMNGRKRTKLENVYKLVDMYGQTRDMPKYLFVLTNGAVRHRALQEGEMFVAQGRLDSPEDIFWCTLDEIDAANTDPNFDLRQAKQNKQPIYRKLEKVRAFPHLIDSRGRIGQTEKPTGDPNVLSGLGISRGVATGRVKVLHTPREKPIEKGDVLVAYTTDPGWTPLFVNAEAIILEVGGMLQHGGVVAREYGKPSVAGIQGVITTLQDGQLVEVDGTTGVVRILEARISAATEPDGGLGASWLNKWQMACIMALIC